MRFNIIPTGDVHHDLVLEALDAEPEFLGRFDNQVRAWMAAKDAARERGVNPGTAPRMRQIRLPKPRGRMF
ncbi:MAG: hypothetical protein AAGD13_14435 [Pseudomonadota bacterium]